ncbi:MAG: DUF177 domain-containing protein [Desulfitobacterium sp.]|nr:DUF177 domain-containing protein [Desulfitobacterium sp.]
MLINVAAIRRAENGTGTFDLQKDFSQVSTRLEGVVFVAPVHVKIQVDNSGDSLLVRGQIKSELDVQCDRCLTAFRYPVHIDYEDEWIYAPQATEEQSETALIFDKDDIDLTERIYEQIILEFPMRFICSPQCKGLCSSCGENLNQKSCDCVQDDIDPRLAALAKWPRED